MLILGLYSLIGISLALCLNSRILYPPFHAQKSFNAFAVLTVSHGTMGQPTETSKFELLSIRGYHIKLTLVYLNLVSPKLGSMQIIIKQLKIRILALYIGHCVIQTLELLSLYLS